PYGLGPYYIATATPPAQRGARPIGRPGDGTGAGEEPTRRRLVSAKRRNPVSDGGEDRPPSSSQAGSPTLSGPINDDASPVHLRSDLQPSRRSKSRPIPRRD